VLSFYFDEHVDPRIAGALQARGIDALTAQSAGRAGQGIPDPMQLAHAAVAGRVLISGDWDFLAYAGTVHPRAGVVIIPRHVPLGDAILYREIVASTRRPVDYANRLLVYPASL
jgi:predicted nuclease of predicted toxin-antitoxin system